MKKIIFVLIMMLPLIGNAQAHLALTLTEIKALYPDKVFKVNYTNDGTKYAYTDMSLGMFFYYFDSKTGLTNLCLQVPDDMIALNTQVEIYNKKYVIVSETSWKAYLEDGGLIKIDLTYDEELKNYIFIYTHYGYYTH